VQIIMLRIDSITTIALYQPVTTVPNGWRITVEK